jgi:hypothetical protein
MKHCRKCREPFDGLRCKPCFAAYHKGWYASKRAEVLEQCRQRHHRFKMEVLGHYGGACACCGESQHEFLSIDHINGGGGKHRAEINRRGVNFYRWLKQNDYPEGYRVLCHNCNQARGYLGYCPHERAALAVSS